MENKSLATLNIKLLFTNIPVNKCIRHLEIQLNKTIITLPLPVYKIIKMCILSMKRGFFQYNCIFLKTKI